MNIKQCLQVSVATTQGGGVGQKRLTHLPHAHKKAAHHSHQQAAESLGFQQSHL